MLSFKCQDLEQLGMSPQKEGKQTAQQIENMVTWEMKVLEVKN